MNELRELAEKRAIDAVYMVHSDRLSRDLSDHLQMRKFFKRNKVKMNFVSMPGLDTDTASGATMDSILAVLNEHQRMTTSEKTKSALYEKAKEGWFPGVAPVGYKNVDNPNHRTGEISRRIIIPDETMASLVTETFKLYSTGNYSGLELNDLMYDKGLRTKRGGKIHVSKFYAMLVNPLYVGELHWGPVYVKKAKHTPLVDKQTFSRVQSVLASHNRNATRRRKHFFLLRGIIRCDEHRDKRYTAEYHEKKNGKKYAYYHCTNRGGCKGGNVRTDYLEDEVAVLLKDLSFSKALIDRITYHAKKKFDVQRKEHDRNVKRLESQRAQLLSRRSVAENKLFKGVLSDDDFTRIRKDIATEIEIIDEEIEKLESKREIKVDIAQEVLRFTRDVYNAYRKANYVLKRLYLLFFFDEIYVYDGKVQQVAHSKLFEALLEIRAITTEKAQAKSDPQYNKLKMG